MARPICRRLEYDDSAYDDLARVLRDMGTAKLARQTGYDPSMARGLKRGECRPNPERLRGVLAAAHHAQGRLAAVGWPAPEADADAVGLYVSTLPARRSGNSRAPLE